MDKFLEAEQEQWTCKECGHIIAVHTGVCSGCGKQNGAQVAQMSEDTWRIEDGMKQQLLKEFDALL